MKDLQANVGKAVPITFSTYGAHSALAAAMIVPVSIAIQLVTIAIVNFCSYQLSSSYSVNM